MAVIPMPAAELLFGMTSTSGMHSAAHSLATWVDIVQGCSGDLAAEADM